MLHTGGPGSPCCRAIMSLCSLLCLVLGKGAQSQGNLNKGWSTREGEHGAVVRGSDLPVYPLVQ